MKKLFATMDSSGDGAINFEEFSKLVKSPKLRFGSRSSRFLEVFWWF